MKNMTWPVALAVLLLVALPAAAQWIEDGNPVCTTGSLQQTVEMVPDGRGGAIMVWQDYRMGSYSDLFAQRVDRYGRSLWITGGVSICLADSNQTNHKVVSDGAGGAIIVWADNRKGSTNPDIYAQWVDSSGNAAWAANGAAICDTISYQRTPAIATDNAGGAIVTWSDFRSGSYDIYSQRILKTGVVAWTRNGVAICNAVNNQLGPVITVDSYSGAIIAWYDYRSGTNYDIFAQRILGNGTINWTANGVVVCDTLGSQLNPAIATDGYSGAVITWQDLRGGTYDIYAQRLLFLDGSICWTKNGALVNNSNNHQQNPAIVFTGDYYTCKCIIAFETGQYGNNDILIKELDYSGSSVNTWVPGWTPGDDFSPKLIPDGAGGAIVAWYAYSYVTNSYDICAYRANSPAEKQWTLQTVCDGASSQQYPAICSDETGGAIVAWQDTRNGPTNADIYAQRLDGYDGSYYGRNAPTITGIQDIPNDQGGYVNLQWTPSYLDVYPDTTISFYSLWRSLSGTAAKSLISKGAKLVQPSDITIDFTGPAYRLIEKNSKAYAWEWIANVPWKHYLTAYSYPMPTLCDTLTGEMAWHHFFVSAQTDDSQLYWDSYPDSGYSVDDLAPAKVLNLGGAAAKALVLNWKKNLESDLRDYAVYNNGGFLGFTAETSYVYSGPINTNDYFTVTAYDIHNNQGPAADPWIYLGPQAVHLSFFAAGQINEAVELRWRTESETDCAAWIIQRSISGATAFADIGKIPGQGTSTMPHDYIYRDSEQLETGDYLYRIVEISATGNKTCYQPVSVTYRSNTPKIFSLIGAYPNPARGATTIKYQLPEESQVRVDIYNVSGQIVKTVYEGVKPAGYHQINWSDNTLPNGIYFYQLKARLSQGSGGQAGEFSATRKLLIVK